MKEFTGNSHYQVKRGSPLWKHFLFCPFKSHKVLGRMQWNTLGYSLRFEIKSAFMQTREVVETLNKSFYVALTPIWLTLNIF